MKPAIAAATTILALAALALIARAEGPQPAALAAFLAFVAAALALATTIEDAIDNARERRKMVRRVIWPAHLAYMRDPQ